MQLTGFIQSLITDGTVTVAGDVRMPGDEDSSRVSSLLGAAHGIDSGHLAGEAPAFDGKAAHWAAAILYRAIQCHFLRYLTDEKVISLLPDYDGEVTPEAIYSADLMLRHLPAFFHLVRHTTPGDVLLHRLKSIAAAWPLSSVGINTDEAVNPAAVMQHPSLRMLYIDRIIATKDTTRCQHPDILRAVQEVIGDHESAYWPGLSLQS